MPRVSILLTCYNHLAYLPAALEGVWKQTFTDYEIIALDDGSSDGTREWLASRPEPMTCVFNERNLGTYGTLNVGLKVATGEFIAVLNDDDVWLPNKLERQIALLDREPRVGLVHTDGFFIDGSGKRQEGTPLGFEFPRFETGNLIIPLIYANKIIASAALARRSCFDQLGGFNEAYFGSGDWEMWFRIAEQWDVGFVAEPLTLYRVHGANASHKLDRIWRDDERLRDWIAARAPGFEGRGLDPVALRKALAHNQACLGTVRCLNGDPTAARAAYVQSLRLQPGRFKSMLRWAATFLPPGLNRRLV